MDMDGRGNGRGTSHDRGQEEQSVVRLAAVGDLHYAKGSQGAMQGLFSQCADAADILLLCGDLTDFGLAEEARVLAKDLTSVKIPIVAVLGNHDYESGQETEITEILTTAGVRMLDGDTVEFSGVGFAGVRGFCGGFGRGALGPWGESVVKAFVQEAVQEALKLESALQRLRTEHKIVLLHYSPVRDTVEGEPPEIFAFLGSSRLEEPLTRLGATAVFHGHAHRGSPEGKTSTGVPVYNVAHQVLSASYPDQPPFRIFEVRGASADESGSVKPVGDSTAWARRSTDRRVAG
jgi:Icc-related predicted phosphoesterase